jgi:signal recognition particle subunit SRP54
MKRMGGIESIVKMLPGGDKILGSNQFDPEQFKSMEAIICSMNKAERADSEIIDFPRRKRIARGSGTNVEQVGQLIKQFSMMRKMMKSSGLMGRMLGGGGLGKLAGGLGGLGGLAGLGGGGFRNKLARGSNYTPPKKKRKKR